MIKKYKNISRRDLLNKVVDLLNVLRMDEFKLTKKESEFLILLMLLPERFKYERLSTSARKYLLKQIQDSGWNLSVQGMSILIKSLEDKGVIYEEEDGVRYLHKSLLPFIDKTKKIYNIQFEFEVQD